MMPPFSIGGHHSVVEISQMSIVLTRSANVVKEQNTNKLKENAFDENELKGRKK